MDEIWTEANSWVERLVGGLNWLEVSLQKKIMCVRVFRNLAETRDQILAKCVAWAASLAEFQHVSIADIMRAWKDCIEIL